MSRIKTYIIIGCLAVVFILLGSVCFLQSQLRKYKQQYNTEYSNRKALESERDSLSENTELLKYSIQDIKSSNDSLTKALYTANKKLKLKDKSLKQMQYMLSTATRTDSLIYRDTLFMHESIHIDTTLGNKWIQTRLILEYPSTIKVSPRVVSEKMVFMNEVKKGDLERVAFKSEQLRKYFPKSYTPRQMSDVILKLLDQWQKKRQRDKAR